MKQVPFAVLMLSVLLSLPAFAGVEPRLAGEWRLDSATGAPTVFHVGQDGRFKTLAAGVQVETGIFNAIDGKWSVQADTGRRDSGTFSLIADEMVLRSSTGIASHWKRSKDQTASHSYSALSQGLTGPGSTQGSPQLEAGIQVQNRISEAPSLAPSLSAKPAPSLQDAYRAAQASATIAQAARGFRGGVKSGIASMIGAAQQLGAQTAGHNAYMANQAVPPVVSPDIGSGALGGIAASLGAGAGISPAIPSGGTSYSAMRKAFNQQQLSVLPPAMSVSVNPQGDETAEYGLSSFEARANGPIRVTRLSTINKSKSLMDY